MLNNPLLKATDPDYLIPESDLSFADYITLCRTIIKTRRMDLNHPNANLIIDANSPREFMPAKPIYTGEKPKYGVLLVHGLLDCPFSLRDIGNHLQSQGIVCRSILLPGHGTRPADLLTVTWQEWLETLRYGIESLGSEVEQLYLVGYSTGATLSLHEALKDSKFSGLILIAPAIRIAVPMKVIVTWHYLKRWLHINHNAWIDQVPEIDYTKYHSIPFNAATQVTALADTLKILRKQHTLKCPMFMVISEEDRTISSEKAMEFFARYHHPDSRLLLYSSSTDTNHADTRIIHRHSAWPELNIRHLSHPSLPFKPDNFHYGKSGDYLYASHPGNFIDGTYSRVDLMLLDKLYQLKLIKNHYRQLTYNPDFDFMAGEITRFILRENN